MSLWVRALSWSNRPRLVQKGNVDDQFGLAIEGGQLRFSVRLVGGKLAVVTAQNAQNLLAPKVKAFFSTKSNMRIEPLEMDLGSAWCQDKVLRCESPDDWKFKDLDILAGVQRNG
jgi:hypothetical protein